MSDFALVGNRLHHWPPLATCRVEDARELTTLTEADVDEHERLYGGFDRCEHCFPSAATQSTAGAPAITFDVLRTDAPEDAP